MSARRRERVEVTLRGVRVEPHPKNPARWAGMVVPWERVRLGSGVMLLDERGKLMRARLCEPAFPMDAVRSAAAFGMMRRRVTMPGFRLEETYAPKLAETVIVGVMAAGLLWVMVMGISRVMSGNTAGMPTTVHVTMWIAAGLVFVGLPCAMGFMFLTMVRPKVFPPVVRAVYTDVGIEVQTRAGHALRERWSDLREMKAMSMGLVKRLVFADGVHIDLPFSNEMPKRLSLYMLATQQRRLKGEQRSRHAIRRIMIFTMVASQLGGIVAGVATALMPTLSPWSPWAAYAWISLALPVQLGLLVALAVGITRFSARQAKARRERDRAWRRAAISAGSTSAQAG